MADTSFSNYVKRLEEDPETRQALDAARAEFADGRLRKFVRESNRIESILNVSETDVQAHRELLALKQITVDDLVRFVRTVASAKGALRGSPGMDVRVGDHFPPRGGPHIEQELRSILDVANKGLWSPYSVHCEYERIHPFMDGNGRSGRALWAWMYRRIDRDPFALPFLHRWYYDSLDGARHG